MNKRRLAAIARWLEAGAPHKRGVNGFDMTDFRRECDCGTVCCIGGAAIQWFGNLENTKYGFVVEACRVLGLDEFSYRNLFIPEDYLPAIEASPAWAARCIRKLIATGEVDWEGTK